MAIRISSSQGAHSGMPHLYTRQGLSYALARVQNIAQIAGHSGDILPPRLTLVPVGFAQTNKPEFFPLCFAIDHEYGYLIG